MFILDAPADFEWLLDTSTLAHLMPLKAGASMPLFSAQPFVRKSMKLHIAGRHSRRFHGLYYRG